MTPEALSQRYALLCESTRVEPDEKMLPYEIEKGLNQLEHIITRDLREWAQSGAPDNFFDIDFALQRELERFKEFCAYPALAKKLVVAFGGGFSAGKSTLINTLLGEKLLVAEVDPTTALPTYILQGENNTINAFNLFGNRIELTESEFLSLTHDEMQIYGSNISRLLRAAFITRCDFAWNNIAFIDTPGYTKHEDGTQSDRTDAHIARTQLNAAQAVVWVIDIRQGCITEDDLKFLNGLQKDIPIFIALTRADQKPENDIPAIQNLISKTLQEHGIAFSGIIPVSSRKPRAYPLDMLKQQLNQWNESPCELRFATNFSTELNRCAEFLQNKLQQATESLKRFNSIMAMNDNKSVQADATVLQKDAKGKLETLKNHLTQFQNIQTQFLDKLVEIGKMVGVDFSEILTKKSIVAITNFFEDLVEDKILEKAEKVAILSAFCDVALNNLNTATERNDINTSTLDVKNSKQYLAGSLGEIIDENTANAEELSQWFTGFGDMLRKKQNDNKPIKTTKYGLQINNDGTVYDPKSKLMWKREHEQNKNTHSDGGYFYNEAIDEFGGSNYFIGYNDWRLPTLYELKTLLLKEEPYTKELYIDTEAFPNGKNYFWSNTPKAGDSGMVWYIGFKYGTVSTSYGGNTARCVRLVRSV